MFSLPLGQSKIAHIFDYTYSIRIYLVNSLVYLYRYISKHDMEVSKKKLALQYLIYAVCQVTFQIFGEAEDEIEVLIRPNFFQNLHSNITKSADLQLIGFDMEITNMLMNAALEMKWIGLKPQDAITDLNVIPNQKDLTSVDEVFLRPNLVGTVYPDRKSYLDTQFRLLREDFFNPLRQALSKELNPAKEKTESSSSGIYIYEEVTFLKGGLINAAPRMPERSSGWRFFKVQFKKQPGVDWKKSRRLIPGSLLFLSDGGSELLTATVANIQ